MAFKYNRFVYETGSIKGASILDVEYDVKLYNYVKVKIGEQTQYLRITDGKTVLGNLDVATPLSKQDALKYVRLYRERGIDASLFSCTKKS